MPVILRRLAARLRAEDGFTLVTVMGTLVVVGLFAAAAFAAADGDLRPSMNDRERKEAYAAAEAGINDYLARLGAQTDYWKTCTTAGTKPKTDAAYVPLNDPNPTVAARRWKTVPGSTAEYSIEILAANGKAACDTADPAGTFIDTDSGTFRIRSTGRASATAKTRRSIVTTFRRKGFLDYIYFTDLENVAPALMTREVGGLNNRENPSRGGRDIVRWAEQQCSKYWRDKRGDERFIGTNTELAGKQTGSNAAQSASWTSVEEQCGEIRFFGEGTDETRKDKILGPFHTNDEIRVCGQVQFGRRPADDIEIVGAGPNGTGTGWMPLCTGSAMVVNQPGETLGDRGTYIRRAAPIALPPSNVQLRNEALPAYRFVGRLKISLEGDRMTVLETAKRESGQTVPAGTSIPLPLDGVVYVSNDNVACKYDPLNPYGASAACGDVYVEGVYQKNLTINAANDIVVTNDIQRDGDVMLGLVSDGWTRVYHPTTGCSASGGGTNTLPDKNLTIQAAILSVQQSFTVDSFWCGARVGVLTVEGAIGQRYRGPVATSGGSTNTGYIKNYVYDDRFRFRTPPRFLDPVQSAWKVKNQFEQIPAATS